MPSKAVHFLMSHFGLSLKIRRAFSTKGQSAKKKFAKTAFCKNINFSCYLNDRAIKYIEKFARHMNIVCQKIVVLYFTHT